MFDKPKKLIRKKVSSNEEVHYKLKVIESCQTLLANYVNNTILLVEPEGKMANAFSNIVKIKEKKLKRFNALTCWNAQCSCTQQLFCQAITSLCTQFFALA